MKALLAILGVVVFMAIGASKGIQPEMLGHFLAKLLIVSIILGAVIKALAGRGKSWLGITCGTYGIICLALSILIYFSTQDVINRFISGYISGLQEQNSDIPATEQPLTYN